MFECLNNRKGSNSSPFCLCTLLRFSKYLCLMQKKKDLGYWLACIVLIIGIVIFQQLTSLNVVAEFLSLAVLLMTMLISAQSSTFIVALAASVLTAIGFYYSLQTVTPDKFYNLVYNRVSALASIWIAAFLIVKFKKSREVEKLSNQRMNALFLYATEGIIITNSAGKIVMVNPEAEKQFGFSRNELIGNTVEMLVPERFSKEHIHHRAGYYKSPRARYMGTGGQLFGKRKDGSEFPVEISLSSFHTADGMFVVSFILDMTELLKQKELTRALEKEVELNELKARFVSMASHEFRTPLSTILSSVALVEKYNEPTHKDDRERHINRIRSSVKNLTNILNDFLSLDKLDAGQVHSYPALTDIEQLAKEVIEEMQVVAKEGQTIEYAKSGLTEVFVDGNLLRNILINLINNAIKYSPENSRIELSTKTEDGYFYVSVKDYGIGIPDEDKPYMFDRFFRAKNATNIKGTGLGLNIVRRYADLMGGHIDFTSELNKGTTFTFKYPLVLE